MTLKDEVVRLLRSASVRTIHFSFTSVTSTPITISHGTFERVAKAIESGHIGISNDMSKVSAGADAEYHDDTDILYVTPTHHRRYKECVVVHECVHAWFDLTRAVLPTIDNEVAAYLAGEIYLLRTGLPPRRYAHTLEAILRSTAVSALRPGPLNTSGIVRLRRLLLRDSLYSRDMRHKCGGGGMCWSIDREDG